ncbi:lytic transglycosylase domain-containing protein [Rhodobacter capsulatus]|uniref:lytic transglycosylase domain-containing protein n=1 Tax=Rhodobacter capsulatus TaxID=1061 RepID=UPI0006DC26A7|nr:lytic transglycosylase domain-containing protein [Rhodobacter capsulatus]KQB13302.1 lytic murein transglycosylase [Rhodobacter capsulatus]KQB13560.1 lytic murein transglycosylase [Rhodobacter capsulatus]PZX24291.1 soluble lytic murein transglycosylase-like protein [Rhodobacter capsulatus]QNR63732.1 lytic transglycosylase domain-containing protein [Rhodobacter capsulatus]
MRRIIVVSLALSATVAVVPALAEIGPKSPTVHHFEPRRVLPPKAGQTRFLTIQINPEEQAAALAAQAAKPFAPLTATPPPASGTGAGTGRTADGGAASYAWFWKAVSPTLSDRAGRFQQAIDALSMGPGGQAVRAPRLASLQAIAQTHGRDILAATIGTEVSPALVLAVISTESGGQADAVSRSGAVGLMQLIPATATRFAVSDSRDPSQNIKGGVAYLNWLMKEFDRDPLMVIAAYNAGENAVKGNGGVPPYAETRDYVPKVLAAWQVARGLCLSPPELVTDGCVFASKG